MSGDQIQAALVVVVGCCAIAGLYLAVHVAGMFIDRRWPQ